MIRVVGCSARISREASTPEASGSRTSIRTMSGLSRLTARTAPALDPASPTTVMPWLLCKTVQADTDHFVIVDQKQANRPHRDRHKKPRSAGRGGCLFPHSSLTGG